MPTASESHTPLRLTCQGSPKSKTRDTCVENFGSLWV